MPIIQVRASRGEQCLAAPATHRDAVPILSEWRKDEWHSEMFVYPPGYVGDVTPQGPNWNAYTFMLSVDQDGDQAHMMAGSKRWTAQETAEAIEYFRALRPEQAKTIGTLATVNERNSNLLIASMVNSSIMAIGGIVMHASPSKLRTLGDMFPTTVIEPDA